MRDRFNQNQMAFEDFIEAMEYIVNAVVGYNQDNKLQVMQSFVDSIIQQIEQWNRKDRGIDIFDVTLDVT
jgi:predicted metal-dependent hydrolase